MHRVAYLARALRLRVNVLLIDADIFVFQDPYRWGGRGGGRKAEGVGALGWGGERWGQSHQRLYLIHPSLQAWGRGEWGAEVPGRSAAFLR